MEALPDKLSDMEHFTAWDMVVPIEHGYDESQPEGEVDLENMRKAADFRGGRLLSASMTKSDWRTRLDFRFAFGHRIKASPLFVLEDGHWCDACARKSRNYSQRAKVDPFFARVWNTLHEADALRDNPKEVSGLDV